MVEHKAEMVSEQMLEEQQQVKLQQMQQSLVEQVEAEPLAVAVQQAKQEQQDLQHHLQF
jgi:hypothetical protein